MQLYVFPPSPNSLCCQAVANQAGVTLELVPVDLPSGGQMSEEFIKLNPNHKIPTLVDGDFSLWESGAIMIYLAHQSEGHGLIPEDFREHVQMAQWMFWKNSHWGAACGIYTFENLVKKLLNLGDPDPAQLEKGEEEFKRFATVLNDHLEGRTYIVNDNITLADHGIASWLVHAEGAQIPLADYPEVQRWSRSVLAGDPWQQALATIPRE